MSYVAVDLSRLPTPAIIEPLDFETILAELKAALAALAPELAPALDVESDTIQKVLQVWAYRELLLRGRINDTTRANMLATSTGSNLDNLAALFGVSRLVVTPANPTAIPPTSAVMETDADLRSRTQLALEGYSTAGPRGAYLYHAYSASGQVKDVAVFSPAPGSVQVVILSKSGDGTPDASLVAAVADALNNEEVRPLCDQVAVSAATVSSYSVSATLRVSAGPDPAVIQAEAVRLLEDYTRDVHRIGRAVRLSGIYAALHRPGVTQVTLASPVADIITAQTEAAFCTSVNITVVVDQ